MMAITVNDVRDGVISTLAKHFPEADIYGEEIKQGLEEPCFFLKLFPFAQDREFGRRYIRYHTFDIHYFPESKMDANEEMFMVAEKLLEHLEYIKVGEGLCRGTKMESEIVDGILHFKVDYDIHVMREKKEEPYMQTLEQREGLK
ncbi:hypothetical protein FLT15_07045 [Paenibacillus thiaminolyticus]|nr:hypothetical protein [Paenibacillus thiaminolyticus]